MLLKRNQIYYFRWQIPADLRPILGQTELIRSTGCSELRSAKLASEPYLRIVRLIKQVRELFMHEDLNEENYKEVLGQIWLFIQSIEFMDSYGMNEFLRKHEANLDYYRKLSRNVHSSYFECNSSVLSCDGTGMGFPLAEKIAAELQFAKIPEQEIELLSFIEGIFRYNFEYRPVGDISGRAAKEILGMLIRKIEQIKGLSHQGFDEVVGDKARGVTVNQLWTDYEREKVDSKVWSDEKMIKSCRNEKDDFIEMLGGDLPLLNIDRDKAKDIRTKLLAFPKNRQQKYKNTLLKDIPQHAECISESSANQRLGRLRSFFQYGVNEGKLSSNIFTGIDIKSTDKSYATYTSFDIEELFNLPVKMITKEWQYWIPRVALFTGARQAEIAQLTLSDVIKEENTGIWYFSINDSEGKKVKNASSIRKVPIHSELLNNGFLDYFNSLSMSDNKSLWPDLSPKSGKLGNTVGAWWTRLKKEYKLLSNPVGESGRKKVFHSLRRTFINGLHEKDTPLVVLQRLVGHEPQLSETKTYIDEVVSLEKLQKAVDSFSIDGVNWNRG